jgi:hypothetical protein
MKAYVKAAMFMGAAMAGTFVLSGCSVGGGGSIKAADIEGEWPLTVDQVKLVCRDDLAIFIEAGDKTYPLNGQAERNESKYKEGQLSRIEDIQKDDKVSAGGLVPGIKVTLDPLLKTAIARCEKSGKWKI